MILESLDRTGPQGTEAIRNLKLLSPIVNGLIANPKVSLALLFVDITSFSTYTSSLSSIEITAILDQYYQDVLPIIYKHNGEVEKIMGDGIVAVFGPPFTKGTQKDLLNAAENCAAEMIMSRYSAKYPLKVALHYGNLVYYHNKNTSVDEFYALGKPMTELFRLESECINKHIGFFGNSDYHYHRIWGYSTLGTAWVQQLPRTVSLKGVDYNQVIDLK